ncbi:hypothetical protein CPB85DRAFT_120055 [Mucidula mucida]|nr:hypothetical protein CPB85DRAFT_120055 [Mucidula mucida]
MDNSDDENEVLAQPRHTRQCKRIVCSWAVLMIVPLRAALASILLACIQPLQYTSTCRSDKRLFYSLDMDRSWGAVRNRASGWSSFFARTNNRNKRCQSLNLVSGSMKSPAKLSSASIFPGAALRARD